MSTDEYIAGLEWVRLKRPNHPLLPELGESRTQLNIIYLRKIIEQISDAEKRQLEPEKPAVEEFDPQMQILLRERATLFGHRRKLSNSFHTCTTNAQRAEVSDDIQQVQRKIETVMRQIRIFGKTGQMPEEDAPKESSLTGVALMMKYRSVVSNISHSKRKIEGTAGKSDPDTLAKRKKWETRLKELQDERIRLERAIARESV